MSIQTIYHQRVQTNTYYSHIINIYIHRDDTYVRWCFEEHCSLFMIQQLTSHLPAKRISHFRLNTNITRRYILLIHRLYKLHFISTYRWIWVIVWIQFHFLANVVVNHWNLIVNKNLYVLIQIFQKTKFFSFFQKKVHGIALVNK